MRTHQDSRHRATHAGYVGTNAGLGVPAASPLRAGIRPSPAEVVRLQRTAGNAATARMLNAQRATAPGPRPRRLQRDEKSAKLLTELATPTIGEGPAIAVQKKLVSELETLFTQESASEINLGGILLDSLPDSAKDKQDLFAQTAASAALWPLPATIPGESFRSAGADRAENVVKAGLGPLVIENTLKTMIDARQLEYLRLAGLPNAQWKILIEVHYIRSRPKDMAGFHKDTKGESLFVNLNYHVGDNTVVGPEYVVNPAPSAQHDAQIYGTPDKKGTLPKAFTDDLDVTRTALGQPSEIRSGIVNPYGYVAFVDEAIHHATPYYGHRYVTGKELGAYLAHRSPAEFAEISRARKQYDASCWPTKVYPFSTYVDKTIIPEADISTWDTWLARASHEAQTYTRAQLADMMSADDFDLMLEYVGSLPNAPRAKGGSGGWYAANIPGSELAPFKPKDRPPLKRQGSTADFTQLRPPQLPEDVPRRFLRTWVRVVPEEKAAKLRTWATDQGLTT